MSKTRNGRSSSTKKGKIAKVSTKKLVGRGKRKTAKLGKVKCGGGALKRVLGNFEAKRAIRSARKEMRKSKKNRAAEFEKVTAEEEQIFQDMEKRQEIEGAEMSEKIEKINKQLKKPGEKKSTISFYENELQRLLEEQEEMKKRHENEFNAFTDTKESVSNDEEKKNKKIKENTEKNYYDSVKHAEVEKYKQRIDPKIRNIERLYNEIERIFGHVENKKSIAGDVTLPTRVVDKLYVHYETVTNQMQKKFIEKIKPAPRRTLEKSKNTTDNPILTGAKGQSMNWFSTTSDDTHSYFGNILGLTSSKPSAKPVEAQEGKQIPFNAVPKTEVKEVSPNNNINGISVVKST